MAQGSNNINFQINFNKGETKALDALKADINEIRRLAHDLNFTSGMDPKKIQKMVSAANTLETSLTRAYDLDLNTINVQKFNQLLAQSGMNVKTLQKDLSAAGVTGQQAFLKMTGQMMQFNQATVHTSKFLDNISNSLFNTVKYTAFNAVLNSISSTISHAYSYVKELDSSLNDIRIVTGKSADEMERFAEQANDAAKNLAVTTGQYTEGSLIYYQQGLDDNTVQTLTDITAKASNVTQQSMSTVSEQLTAVQNGYKVANQVAEEGMGVYEEYVDKMAAVGASTASNLEELSTAMSKVASAASSMGVGFDDLNAQIATIVSVTRQAPESVGTALKTIYARLGDLKVDGVDEFGTKLGDVSKQLQTMGINIVDQTGNMRNMSDVIAEVAQKQDTQTSAQKQAAAVAMAGKRQYNNLVALFDNQDMYGKALETSMNAAGTLEKQQEIAMDSLANKMDVLKATAEDLYDSLFNVDTMKNFAEAGTGILQFLADFADAIGGLNNLIPMLGSIGLQVFSDQIGRGLGNLILNFQNAISYQNLMKDNFEQLSMMYSDSTLFTADKSAPGDPQLAQAIATETGKIYEYYKEMYPYQSMMTKEQKEQYDTILNTKIKVGELAVEVEKQGEVFNKQVNYLGIIDKNIINELDDTKKVTAEVEKLNEIITTLDSQLHGTVELTDDFNLSTYLNLDNVAGGENSLRKINNEFNHCKKNAKDMYGAVEAFVNKLRGVKDGLDGLVQTNNKMNSLRNSSDQAAESLHRIVDMQKKVSNIVSTISSVGQLAMSINTLSNIGSIQEREDLDISEKFLQTLMNASFVIGPLSKSLSNLGGAILGVSDAQISKVAATEAETAATTASTLADDAKKARILANTAAQELATAEEEKAILVQEHDSTATQASATKIRLKSDIITKEAQIEKLRAASTAASTAAENAETIATNANKTSIIANNSAKAKEILCSKGNVIAKIKEIQAIKTHKIEVDKDTMSLATNKLALLSVVAAAALVVAGIVAVVKVLEKQREEEKKLNEEIIQNAKNRQEEIDSVYKVLDTYEKANKVYKETGKEKDKLREASSELIKTYKIENAAILEQADYYDQLAKAAKDAKKDKLKEDIDVSTEAAKAAATEVQEVARVDGLLKEDNVYKRGNKLNSQFHVERKASNETENEAAQLLKNYFKDNENVFSTFDEKHTGTLSFSGYNINDPESIYKFTQDISEAIKVLKNTYTDEQLEEIGFYENLVKVQSRQSEQLPALEEQVERIRNAKTQLASTKIDQSEIYDDNNNVKIDELNNKINILKENLTKELPEYLSESDIDKYVKDILINVEQIPQTALEAVNSINKYINKKAAVKLDVDKDKITEDTQKAIKNFNQSQLNYLVLHLDTIPLNKELEDQKNEHQDFLDYLQGKEISNGFRDFFGKYDEKKGFEEGAISELYSNEDISSSMGISESGFEALDLGNQIHEAASAQIEWVDNTEEARKKTQELLEGTEEVEGSVAYLQKQYNDYVKDNPVENNIKEQIKNIPALEGKYDELSSALMKYAKGEETLSLTEKQLIAIYALRTDQMDGAIIKGLGEELNQTEQLYNTQQFAEEELRQLIDSEVTFKDKIEQVTQATKAHNAIMDEMQSNYKTLIGIVDNYNETGKQTIDNVQTLMEMSDKYVAQLEFEGNTLSLNEEGFKALTLAKIDDLQATEELAYQVKINELANIALANSNDTAAQKEALHALQLEALGVVAEGTAQKLLDVADAMAAIDNFGSEEVKEAEKQATQAHENRRKALEALRKQVESSSGSGGMRDMMGASKKDSKSGGGKDKDKDQKEQEDEFDRYQEIKKAIEAVDNALKKLDKDQENLYGYELIASLKQENELLEQQAANYERLYEMQQQEAAELREQLGTMGLMFDASGAITNYAAATSAALQQYAAAIEQYNAGLIDETTFKVYEKSYENFKKLLDRYDKLYYTEMQNTQDKLDELRRKELANNLKAWEVEIQIHLDKEKMKRDWNDFLKDIKQDFRKVFSDLTIDVKYDEKNFKSFVNDVGTTLKAVGDVEAEIDKMMGGGSSDMFESVSQAQEKLKDLQEQLLDQGKSLRELYKQVQETYLNGIDQVKDKFEELMKIYERFNDELEYHRQLIELLYGDKAYDLMDKYYEAQSKNINAQIDSLRKQTDMQKDEFQKSYEHAIKSGSKVDINDFTTQTEDMKKAYENMLESQQNLNDLVLEGVKVLQNQYLNTINKIMDTMDQGIQGKDGFEGMKSNQEFMQKMADEYLDDVEGAAKIQTFANQMDMDKANASNLKAQQKIQAFREKEIKTLREKENLTQADIDLAEARYQLMLKEIALEDAQNNKTSMKLTRNEQGNQSYQYVADEDDTAQKQQDLLQQYSDLYKLADDSYNHSLELAMSLQEEYVEKYREIAENTNLTEEQKLQKQQELYDQYYPQFVAAAQNAELYKQEAMQASAGVFQTVCEQDSTAYNTLTEEQKRLVDELKDKNFEDYDDMRTHLMEEFYPDLNRTAEEVFGDLNINSQTTAAQVIGDQAKDSDSVKNEINKAVNAMQKAIQDYEKELDKLQEVAGIDFSQVGNYIDQVSQKIDNMNGTTEKMVSDSSSYLDELRRVLDGVAQAQDSVIQQILDAQRAIQEYLALMGQARSASTGGVGGGMGSGSVGSPTGKGPGGTSPTSPTSPEDESKQGKGTIQYLDKVEVVSETADGYQVEKLTYANSKDSSVKDSEYRRTNRSFSEFLGKARGTFASGGYTGQQNNGDTDGRLAMLHQKELVLNADDTKNFLSGINIIRDMTSLNGSISNAITTAVANMVLSLSKVNAGTGPSTIDHKADTAPNIFNITAEFPNANDVNEIREAILSLPNLASQRVGYNLR